MVCPVIKSAAFEAKWTAVPAFSILFANASQGISLNGFCIDFRIFPQSSGKIGSNQSPRNTIHTHIFSFAVKWLEQAG
jgi:hypothetical protein